MVFNRSSDGSEEANPLFEAILNNEPNYDLPLFQSKSDSCLDLVKQMLMKNPEERITIQDALDHEFFRKIDAPRKMSLEILHTEKKLSLYQSEASSPDMKLGPGTLLNIPGLTVLPLEEHGPAEFLTNSARKESDSESSI